MAESKRPLLAIEAPKPAPRDLPHLSECPFDGYNAQVCTCGHWPTLPRKRIPSPYPTNVKRSERNPDAVTSVTVIVTYADKEATSETFNASDLRDFQTSRIIHAPRLEQRTMTITALDHYDC